MIETIKLSRRDFTKAVMGAGAFLALPHLPKIPVDIIEGNLKSDFTTSEPLVVVVKNNELVGFRGLEEFAAKDNRLVEVLSSRYINEPESKYSEKDPVVVLLKDDKSIRFRGLGEFILRDDVGRRLFSIFRNVGA